MQNAHPIVIPTFTAHPNQNPSIFGYQQRYPTSVHSQRRSVFRSHSLGHDLAFPHWKTSLHHTSNQLTRIPSNRFYKVQNLIPRFLHRSKVPDPIKPNTTFPRGDRQSQPSSWLLDLWCQFSPQSKSEQRTRPGIGYVGTLEG